MIFYENLELVKIPEFRIAFDRQIAQKFFLLTSQKENQSTPRKRICREVCNKKIQT